MKMATRRIDRYLKFIETLKGFDLEKLGGIGDNFYFHTVLNPRRLIATITAHPDIDLIESEGERSLLKDSRDDTNMEIGSYPGIFYYFSRTRAVRGPMPQLNAYVCLHPPDTESRYCLRKLNDDPSEIEKVARTVVKVGKLLRDTETLIMPYRLIRMGKMRRRTIHNIA